ncbi:MAG: carboxypeptidase regulatory-like domain-containing protein [Bryobacterales bacterium]|nr:carboxypeptidase regulatory-like domain-containing protein [Bryobacterales bacterium]
MESRIQGFGRLCSLLLAASCVWAQSSQARISGRVLDPDGAAIPAVEVVAINEETGVLTRSQSNEAGVYVLPFLPPGTYTITATASGFKKYERKGLVLETAQELGLDIRMELGSVTEVVEVRAEAPLLESTSATVSQFLDSRVVTEMPLGNRRALELVRLAANTVWVDYSGLAKPLFSLAGGRVENQMFWLDGGNIQNMRLGIGQVDVDPPVEVIREFRVVHNNYSAEFGGSAGGLVISTTKSGTNQFRGSVFEYFRNDRLDAAGFFAPTEGTRKIKAPLRYNLFGATLGGPIVRDRTHFFAGYEGTRRTDGFTQILTVPTELQRRGDFSQTYNTRGQLIPIYDPATTRTVGGRVLRDPFPGNVIPSDRIDPVARRLVAYWPNPNRPPINVAGAQNFSGNRARKFIRDNVTARIDHVFSDKNRFYHRLVYNLDPYHWTSLYPRKEADPESPFDADRYETSFLFADTHTWTSALLMDLRYSFAHRTWHAKPAGLGSNVVQEIGLRGVPSGAFPALSVAGMATLGSSSERRQFPIRQHQWVSNWTWVRGRHVLKFGGELRKSINVDVVRPSISGDFGFATTGTGLPGDAATGFGMASFLVGFVNSFSLRSTDPLDRYSWYVAGFVQDDWKVTPNLTLNLGLRWETDTPIMDKNNRMNSFDITAINPVSGTPGVVRFAGVGGWPRRPYDPDWNNFGPRFGFAWRPFGAAKLVVRGGFGVFFEHPFAHGVPNVASLGFERSAALSSPDNGVTPAFYLGQGVNVELQPPVLDERFGAVPLGRTPTTNVTFYERNRRTGYAQQFHFGIQRELPGNMVLELSYVGNLGRKMPITTLTINQVPPALLGPGNAQLRRPFPQFNNVQILVPTMGAHNYHAGSVRLEKRLSHGLSLLASHTWSRNIGQINESGSGTLGDDQIYQDYYNRRLDKGPLSIDIVHRFAASAVYDLPWGKGRRWLTQGWTSALLGGWTLGSIVNIQSGGPFTVTTQTNTTNAFSAGAQRANVLRNPNLPAENRNIARWFDTEAFVAPPAYTFGNAGRGIVRADGRVNFDFSLNKNFAWGEQRVVQFRVDLFNAFNHPDFGLPTRALGAPGFGTISSATAPRTIQLGLRVAF